MNPQIGFLLNKALESLGNSNLEAAELYLNQALKLQSKNPHVLGFLGIVYAQRGQYREALHYLKDSLKIFPKNYLALSNLGNIYLQLGDLENALDAYKKSIQVDSNYFEAWSNIGNALQELNRSEEALSYYDKALTLKPEYAEAWSNKGNALQALNRFEEALIHYDKALSLNPEYAKGYANKGNALNELKRFEEALIHYDKALSLNPEYAEVFTGKGNTLLELNRFEEAMINHDNAIKLKPDYATAWLNKGVMLYQLSRYQEAITCYEKSLMLKPDNNWVYGYLIHSKMKIGSWFGFSDSVEYLSKKLSANEIVTEPFMLLSLIDDSLLHKQAAYTHVQHLYPLNLTLGPIPKRLKMEKIRIAYFSPDFKSHPVSYLTSELFELHDRSKFEVIAFSLKKAPIGDQVNLRLKMAFDKFIEVDNLSELEIARLVRNLQIDIAIDLAGLTQHNGLGIFSYRAAPIQVSWLGYPGTTGANFIDYIVADKTIIPNSSQHFYSEKVAHLPNCYMVDDSKRLPSARIFTREECDLPKNSFVFCCFNNDFKFNPHVLDRWSKILHTVIGSVLWISENNINFKNNIKEEFTNRGICSSRIVFAQRVDSMADYLAKYKLADLFIDTYPYGAHTTALDSLKAGVPVLTLRGQSFASRVASSLLNTIGLPELIANTEEEYQAIAIQLATTPKLLDALKLRLSNNLQNSPLLNTSLFTKQLELIYTKMYERYELDLEPEHLSID